MENTELIERYFEGRLSPSERQAFEKRLAQEPSFTEEVTLQRRIREGLRAVGRARMLSQLESVENRMSEYHPPTQVIRFDAPTRQRFYWAAAAMVLLLIPVYLWLKPGQSDQKLFAQYFEPYEHTTTQAVTQDPLSQALGQYRDKNYAQALPILEKMIGAGNASDSTLFYKANVHLQLNQPQEAIACLETVLKQPQSGFYDEAQWYLALALLQTGETERAAEVVSEMSSKPAHPYQSQAAGLLKKMK